MATFPTFDVRNAREFPSTNQGRVMAGLNKKEKYTKGTSIEGLKGKESVLDVRRCQWCFLHICLES